MKPGQAWLVLILFLAIKNLRLCGIIDAKEIGFSRFLVILDITKNENGFAINEKLKEKGLKDFITQSYVFCATIVKRMSISYMEEKFVEGITTPNQSG